MEDLENLGSDTLKPLLEALLLVSDDAVAATELARATGAAPSEVAGALAELSVEYREANRGFQLREVAGGWRLFTHPAYHDQVADYVLSWDTRRLSQAALEVLAVLSDTFQQDLQHSAQFAHGLYYNELEKLCTKHGYTQEVAL